VTSTVALVVAISGTAYAATLVTSANIKDNTIQSRDIKNHGIALRDISPTAQAAIRGSAGRIVTTRPPDALLTGSATLLKLSLGAGSWAVMAHVGGVHNGVASSARLECLLSQPGGELDFAKLRTQPNTDVFNSLVFTDMSLNGAVTLAQPGVVKVDCSVVGDVGDTFTMTGLAMTAIRGQSVTVQ
jgi:hypothetical protein